MIPKRTTTAIFAFAILWMASPLLSGCSGNRPALDPPPSTATETAASTSNQTVQASSSASDPEEEPANKREETFFLDPTIGWKAEYAFYGMYREDMVLYHSVDGGENWTEIASTGNEESGLPGGVKSGFVFIDERKGWITANAPWDGKVGLFRTDDGGRTWKEQSLEVPEGLQNAQLSTYPPLFASDEDGILAVDPAEQDTLIYVTSDGGNDWTPILNSAPAIVR